MSESTFARGAIVVRFPDPSLASGVRAKRVGLELERHGVRILDPPGGLAREPLFEWLDRNAPGANVTGVRGHLTLAALPASPADAFYDLTLSHDGDVLTLALDHAEPFAAGVNSSYKDLELTITATRGAATLSASGAVTLVLQGAAGAPDLEVPLAAELAETLAFRAQGSFALDASTIQPPLPDLASFEATALEVATEVDRWGGLQALYAFDEGQGKRVSDSAGSGSPVNAKIEDSASATWVAGGLSLQAGPPIRSEAAATKVNRACQEARQLTLEVWLKPQSAAQNACIFTLSRDAANANLALGQGPNRGFYLDLRGPRAPVHPELKRFRFPRQVETELSNVSITVDREGAGRFFVNGLPPAQAAIAGDVGTFDLAFALGMGAELDEGAAPTSPWSGELHRVAIYSRAMTEKEVLESYRPGLSALGTALAAGLPAPLDQPLAAEASPFPEPREVTLKGASLTITPQLRLDDLELGWMRTEEEPFWLLTGTTKATVWGNSVDFEAGPFGPQRRLSLALPIARGERQDLAVGRWATLSVSRLRLRAVAGPSWAIDTVGTLTLTPWPDGVNGPFAAAFVFDEDRLWLENRETENDPLALIQRIGFDSAARGRMRFRLGAAQLDAGAWRVAPQAGFVEALRDDPRIANRLTQLQLDEHLPVLLEPADPPAAGAQLFFAAGRWLVAGRLDLNVGLGFSFEEAGGHTGNGFTVSGTVAKGEIADFMSFEARGRFVVQGGRASSEGSSALRILGHDIFKGGVQAHGKRFVLEGELDLYPAWSALQISGSGTINVNPSGLVSLPKHPVELSLDGFELLGPRLEIRNGELTLSGWWLGRPVSLTAIQRDGQLIFTGEVAVGLPYRRTVGPIHEPVSGAKVADGVAVDTFDAVLSLELGPSGFLASVGGSFTWGDDSGAARETPLKELTIFSPPETRDELLGLLVAEVESQADELFADRIQHAADYFVAGDGAAPLLVYGAKPEAPPSLETVLPRVFEATGDVSVESSPPVFGLVQGTESTTLTIEPGDRSPEEIAGAYGDLLGRLEGQADARLLAGAADVIRARIAERLPTPISSTLFYHYGLDADRTRLDLHAGMRLRVEYQSYQFVHPSDATARTGFVGGGTSFYHLSHYLRRPVAGPPERLLGFDAFLSNVQTAVTTNASQVGAAGLIDLQQAGYRMAYYRLLYPARFSGSGGRAGPERVATLIGAASLTALGQATDEFVDNGSLTASSDRVSFYFRGRATVVPEIVVFVRENPLYVPVGTTLRQLIERYAAIPAAALRGQDLSAFRGELRPRRVVHEGPDSTASYGFVDLGDYRVFDDGTDVYDLAVVKGDRFYF